MLYGNYKGGKMKATEFVKKYEIKPTLAAGFFDHLRRDPESDLPEDLLETSYHEFSGVKVREIAKEETKKQEPSEYRGPIPKAKNGISQNDESNKTT
ncbi:hypothetical protein LEP1GSC133_4449 [Leptospira borgpetersenii serovar Pomona str. 200901868]|uniref:Uncharacterized protein n=1 Tax=Leptospira borgpetersenii serovar Pomona str. 200901868 TaxID=1192866 RepID=M6VV21_LEPBO|nr:hypothetical protein LEP1GSC133_4449 [Leptospira borgpetersenii serovar Pomona str. 200901868]